MFLHYVLFFPCHVVINVWNKKKKKINPISFMLKPVQANASKFVSFILFPSWHTMLFNTKKKENAPINQPTGGQISPRPPKPLSSILGFSLDALRPQATYQHQDSQGNFRVFCTTSWPRFLLLLCPVQWLKCTQIKFKNRGKWGLQPTNLRG